MKRRAPRPLAAALDTVLEERAPDSLLARVQRAWPEALGAELAAAASPARERDGVITIECRSAAWAAELELMQGEVLERLSASLGEVEIRGFRFTARAL